MGLRKTGMMIGGCLSVWLELIGSVVTKTCGNSISNAPTEEILAETKVCHQSRVILPRSNVRETLANLMLTPALLLKMLDLTVPNALLLLLSSLRRVQNQVSD